MALSVFDDKSHKPTADDLATVLGRADARWRELTSYIATEHAPLDEAWLHSGANWGWSLRLKRKKRAVLYMTPCRRYFLVGFVLGEKAVAAARDSDLPAEVLALIDEAKRYAEGRGIRLEIRTKKDVEVVLKLAAIKMAN